MTEATAFTTGKDLADGVRLDQMEIVAFAQTAPDVLEFSFVDPTTCDITYLPGMVKAYILSKLDERSVLTRAVVTEIPGRGTATMCTVLIPPKDGVIRAEQGDEVCRITSCPQRILRK